MPNEQRYLLISSTLNSRYEWNYAVFAESDSAIIAWVQKRYDFREYRYIRVLRDGDVVMEYKRSV